MKKKYQFSLIIIAILLLITTSIGSSYSLWTITKTQTDDNVVNVANCFELTMVSSENEINMDDMLPLTDQKGLLLAPYMFTVANNCNVSIPYKVFIHSLEANVTGKTLLADQYLKYNIADGSTNVTANLSDSPLLQNDYITRNISGTISSSRMLASGTLTPSSSKTFSLRIWVKDGEFSSVNNADGSVTIGSELMNKYYHAAITVDADSSY